MGSLFKLPVLLYQEVNLLIADLRELGIESTGAVVSGGAPLPQLKFSDRGVAVFVGSEAWGLPAELQKEVDCLVSIPMKEGVDSLSVNAAAAIMLYEIDRNRD